MSDRKLARADNFIYNVETVFREYYGPLCLFASKFLQDEEAVEDIVQDIFIQLLEKKRQFDTILHLKNFLYISTRNACLNFLRGQRVEERYVATVGEDEVEESLEDRIISMEVYKELAAAMEKLPVECRKVFDLCYYEGLDNESAASRLGISVNTVKSQKLRGKKILRENLRDALPLLLFFGLI